MQFYRDGNLFKVARITGPTHNFLCAEMMVGDNIIDKIECLPLEPGEPVSLDQNAVLKEVRAGFQDASKRLGMSITAKQVQFLSSDSPPTSIYRSLAEALAQYFARETLSYKGSSV